MPIQRAKPRLVDLDQTPLTSVTSSNLPAGTVLQCLQDNLTSTFQTNSATFQDTGLTINITPSSTSNKILVSAVIYGYPGHYVCKSRIMRDSTEIGLADADGNRPINALQFSLPPSTDGAITLATAEILDAPSTTSQITYKVQSAARADADGGSHLTYINKSESDRNTNSYDPRTASYITVMEIKG